MSTKHTPGPWGTWDQSVMNGQGVTGPTAAAAMVATKAIENRGYSEFSEVLTIGKKVSAIALGDTRQEAGYNARLIAAAPELLEMLQEVFSVRDRLVEDIYGYEFLRKARAAIAKATGEQV